jgi:hypothetical protein
LYNCILGIYENPDEVLNDIQAESVFANGDTNNKITNVSDAKIVPCGL